MKVYNNNGIRTIIFDIDNMGNVNDDSEDEFEKYLRIKDYLLRNSKPLEKEFSDVINENFFDLL